MRAAAACRALAGRAMEVVLWRMVWGLACMGGWLAWGRLLLQQVLVASPTTQAWGRALVQVSVQEIVEDNFKHNSEIMTFELSNSHHPETTGY